MHNVNVKAVCEKYFRDGSAPPEVRSGQVAYVYLYGKGHELFELYTSSGDGQHLPAARECLEAAAVNYNEAGTSVLPELYYTILLELGAVYSCQSEHGLAINALQHCLRLSREKNYSTGITGALNNLGMVYEQQGDYLKARSSYRESLEEQRKKKPGKDAANYAKTQWNLGRVELRLSNYDEALKLLEPANKVFKKKGFARFYEQSSREIARARRAGGRGGSPTSPGTAKGLSSFVKRLLVRR